MNYLFPDLQIPLFSYESCRELGSCHTNTHNYVWEVGLEELPLFN